MSNGVFVKTNFDREYVWKGGGSVRFLSVDLTAPEVHVREADKQPGLNIALVIDASASMAGRRLDAAIESAMGVLHCLSSDSYLSIVSFASGVFVHIDGVRLDERGKQAAASALES